MYKIIRLPDVVKITGLARSTIYKKMANDEFPETISLGAKSVGWLESDIQKWIESRVDATQYRPSHSLHTSHSTLSSNIH